MPPEPCQAMPCLSHDLLTYLDPWLEITCDHVFSELPCRDSVPLVGEDILAEALLFGVEKEFDLDQVFLIRHLVLLVVSRV